MNRVLRSILAAAILLPVIQACSDAADSVYRNGRVYTMDDLRPWAQALAVEGERLVFVGDDQGVEKYIGPETEVIELGGRMVMPGIHDAHTHLLWAGLQLNYGCQFSQELSLEEMLTALQNCAAGRAKGEWLVAGLFSYEQFPGGKPHRSDLDEVFPDTPVFLRERTFHHALGKQQGAGDCRHR